MEKRHIEHSPDRHIFSSKTKEKMTIYYNPDDPNMITQSKSLLIPLAIIAGGIAMLVGGIVSILNAVKRYKKMKAQEEEWADGK